MCLVEIVSYTLPWRNQADAQVILRASQGQRPEDQLEGTPAALANVIKLCWHQNAQRRPGIQREKSGQTREEVRVRCTPGSDLLRPRADEEVAQARQADN